MSQEGSITQITDITSEQEKKTRSGIPCCYFNDLQASKFIQQSDGCSHRGDINCHIKKNMKCRKKWLYYETMVWIET
jgi:hypothetical protein